MPTIGGAVTFLSPYVHRFGLVTGTRVGLRMRSHRQVPVGQLVQQRVPCLAHPVTFRARTDDVAVFKQVIIDREHEIPFARAPEIVVDLGAHVGLASVRFATRWPKARIWSIEPDQTNFDILVINAERYAPSITCVRAAVWSNTTQLAIENPEASSIARYCRERAAGSVGGVVMDDILDRVLAGTGHTRVGLVKMDIEGAEIGALRDSRWLDRVDTLMIELHDRLFAGCRAALDAALCGKDFIESSSGEYVVLKRRAEIN
jgi:FkbM family methyltransferase